MRFQYPYCTSCHLFRAVAVLQDLGSVFYDYIVDIPILISFDATCTNSWTSTGFAAIAPRGISWGVAPQKLITACPCDVPCGQPLRGIIVQVSVCTPSTLGAPTNFGLGSHLILSVKWLRIHLDHVLTCCPVPESSENIYFCILPFC
jgi:hypothetical protein